MVRVILLGLINGKSYLNVFLNSLFFGAIYYLFLLNWPPKSDFNFYKKVKFNIYCVNQIGIIKYSSYIFYYDFFRRGLNHQINNSSLFVCLSSLNIIIQYLGHLTLNFQNLLD